MKEIPESLKKIGLDEELLNTPEVQDAEETSPARISAVHKERFTVINGEREIPAEPTGKLLFSADSPLDYPAVGDWVLVRYYDEGTLAIIHAILPRKTLLKRKTPGKKVDFQLIAANIDTAFIVQSLDENFNMRRLERYMAMINEAGIRPVILLSKSDLLPPEDMAGKIEQVNSTAPSVEVVPFSSLDGAGLERIKSLLVPAETFCLLGSSGVGKTTLLNNIIGEALFKTMEVREKDSRGRHATTGRQLIVLEGGAMIIDTPGMRELGNLSIDTGIKETFAEIEELAKGCRFKDCAHTHEKGCAVLKAVQEGGLSEERYRNYIKMSRESRFNEMSYYEKRQKDKEFGKMVKSVMKHKKKGD